VIRLENTDETFRPSMKNLIGNVFLIGVFSLVFPLFFFFYLGANGLFILALIFFGGIFWTFWTYLWLKSIWIEVREEGLFIQKGVIAKKRTLLLFSQIQDIKEVQDPLAIVFDIKSIAIVTMTRLSAQSAGSLPYFEASDVDRLRKIVLKRIEGAQATAQGTKMVTALAQELGENYFPLQPKKALLAGITLALVIVCSIGGLIVIVLAFLFGVELGQLLSGSVILFGFALLGVFIASIGFAIRPYYTKYVLGKNQLEIRFEFLSLSKISIPYKKIQDIIIKRGFFERMFGLASVKVETGAFETYLQEGQQLNVIPALLQKDALQLRELLAKTVGCSLPEKKPAIVEEIPLEQRKPVKKTVVAIPILVIIFAVLAILIKNMLPILLLAFALIVLAKFVYEIFYLKKYYYNLSDNALVIRKGVFTIKEIVIPFDKIQNVFVDQDIFDRIFSLWDTHVSTVTPGSEMEGHIDGLNQQNARKIANMLLEKIKQK